jgi:hypothetical protein
MPTDPVELGIGLLTLQARAADPDASPGWVRRRVQRLEFLDTRAVRWRLSVDFIVPEDAPILMIGGEELRLVPVTSMEKTSLIAFSLHDERAAALPLPTSLETTERLRAALVFLASALLDLAEDEFPASFAADLGRIVHDMPGELRARPPALLAAARLLDAEANVGHSWETLEKARNGRGRRERRNAERELDAALRGRIRAERAYRESLSKETDPERTRSVHRRLLRFANFRYQVGELANNFLVHIGTTSAPGTRRVVKLTYESEIRFSRPPRMWARIRQLLGWRCWQVDLLVGGSGGSHHLQVSAPPGVDIVGITAVPVDEPAGGSHDQTARKSLWRRISSWDPAADIKVTGCAPNVQLSPPNAGYRRYRAAIYVRVSRPGWLTGSWLVALVIAGVVTAGRLNLAAVFSKGDQGQAGTAATLLLALLGVFATMLVSPGAHPLAARLLLAARCVIAVDVLIVLFAVGNLVLHQGNAMPTVLWTCLSAIALAAGIILTVSWLLPVARRPAQE